MGIFRVPPVIPLPEHTSAISTVQAEFSNVLLVVCKNFSKIHVCNNQIVINEFGFSIYATVKQKTFSTLPRITPQRRVAKQKYS
jgi:hypothetical protein